ncbi:hypothetical protein ACW9HR_11135 [Nocardia gipuzkoensis]
MRRAFVAAARLGVAGASGLAFVAIAASGSAQAAPQDCVIERDVFSASAICPPDDGLGGAEYVLRVECVGVYSSGPFPLYAVGPYTQLSYPFIPNGQRTTTGCMNWGPGLVGVVTNTYAEIYRR